LLLLGREPYWHDPSDAAASGNIPWRTDVATFVQTGFRGRRFVESASSTFPPKEAIDMADAGPPLVLIALGLVLWLAVNATLAGISIQTIGLILFLVGVVWLVIELVQARRRDAVVVRDRPVVRERDVY
jgi:uncharacterized protein DUF6458